MEEVSDQLYGDALFSVSRTNTMRKLMKEALQAEARKDFHANDSLDSTLLNHKLKEIDDESQVFSLAVFTSLTQNDVEHYAALITNKWDRATLRTLWEECNSRKRNLESMLQAPSNAVAS